MITPKKERELLPPERKRNKQLKVWISQEEQEMIRQKMAEFGTSNLGAFVRKMVIDGYIFKLEIPELKNVIKIMGPISRNLNQMARCLNAGGSIYKEDLQEISDKLDEIYEILRKILMKLSKIKL